MWGWMSYDPELDLVYYGVGNPSPYQRRTAGRATTSGPPASSRAIPATARWCGPTRSTPHDNWDYDAVSTMILADIKIGGRVRKALVTFNKNGFQYTLDRATGELLVGAALRAGDLGQEHRSQDRPAGAGFHQADRRFQGQREGCLPQPRRRGEPGLAGGLLSHARDCSTRRPITCAWTTRRSRRSTSAVRPSSARALPTTPVPAATSAPSWRGMRAPGRWSGRIRNTSPIGAAHWSPPATWRSTARSTGGSRRWTPRPASCSPSSKSAPGVVGNPITYRGPDGKQYVAVYAGIGGDWFLLAGDVRSDDPADVRPPSDPYKDIGRHTSQGGIVWIFGL